MPTNNKPRGSRGKRKQQTNTHIPARPLEEVHKRLQRAITKSTELNQLAVVGRLDQTAYPGASSSDTPPATQQEQPQTGVIRVSVESDSDHPLSPSGEGSDTGEGTLLVGDSNTQNSNPYPDHTVERENRPDGRVVVRVRLA